MNVREGGGEGGREGGREGRYKISNNKYTVIHTLNKLNDIYISFNVSNSIYLYQIVSPSTKRKAYYH